jgi:hypothetical protein
MILRRLSTVLLLLALFAGSLDAQDLVALKKETQRFGDPTENVMDLIAAIRDNLWKEVLLVPDPADQTLEIVRVMAFSRGDLQTGATSSASGSTSAVVSPLLPAIFGAAIENGAITRTVSGTTITIKVNPAGLVCAATADGATAVALRDWTACNRFWARFGVTASFDTSRGEKKTELADLKTLNSQFTELVVRYEALNRRDVTLSRVRNAVTPFLSNAQNLEQRLRPLLADSQMTVERDLVTLVNSAAWKGSTGEVRRKMVEEVVRKVVAETTLPADAARTLWRETLDAYSRVEQAIAGALVVTVDYSRQRADIATDDLAGGIVPKGTRPPDLHVARVVAAKAPLPNLDVTANVSIALFDEKRAGMPDALRDIRVGVEGKFKLRTLKGLWPSNPELRWAVHVSSSVTAGHWDHDIQRCGPERAGTHRCVSDQAGAPDRQQYRAHSSFVYGREPDRADQRVGGERPDWCVVQSRQPVCIEVVKCTSARQKLSSV